MRMISTAIGTHSGQNLDYYMDYFAELQGYDLDEAYKRAERSSENFINSEVERLMKERADKAEIQQKEELKIAKKAKSVNIRGQNTSKAPTGPKGKMFDDMHEIFRDIQSRN